MIVHLPIADIDIPDNRSRDLDEDWVEVLADLICEAGLINPITVSRSDEDRYRLVSGLHRLSAYVVIG